MDQVIALLNSLTRRLLRLLVIYSSLIVLIGRLLRRGNLLRFLELESILDLSQTFLKLSLPLAFRIQTFEKLFKLVLPLVVVPAVDYFSRNWQSIVGQNQRINLEQRVLGLKLNVLGWRLVASVDLVASR